MADWLVTGAGGFLGSRIVDTLGGALALDAPEHGQLDIADGEACLGYLQHTRPRVVVHAAAISDIGACDRDPELARRVNLLGAENVARACAAVGAKLLFCSTDQVYSGCGGSAPLREDAPLRPLNLYARQKLEAEARVAALCPEAVCLRLTWMFDLPLRGRRTNPNLVMNLLKALATGQRLSLPDNDHRAMTYAREVAENLPVMAKAPGGVYNFGSENSLSTYQTARQAAGLLGAEERFAQVAEAVKATGPVERNLSMDTGKAQAAGARFSTTVEGVARMLREYGL